MIRTSQCIAVASVALALLVLTGCTGKVAGNFASVKTGMSPKEVDDLLGPAKETTEIDMGAIMKEAMPGMPKIPGVDINIALPKITAKYWEEGDKGYVVYLQNDKVTQTFSGTKEEMKAKKKKA